MKIKSYRNIVALLETAFILGIPFVRVHGESALRFDIPTLRLYFFGKAIWMQEFFVVLLVLISVTLLFIFFTNLFGRVWCGWLCPQTVLTDIGITLRPKGYYAGWVSHHIIVVLLSMIVSASLVWYFVPPYDFFKIISGKVEGPVTIWFFVSMWLILYLELAFLGRGFCKTICPYAKLQSILFDRHTLVIEFDKDRTSECMGCDKCVRVCPTGIDIKKGLQMECIACAECIDACTSMTSPRGRTSLVGYVFGEGLGIGLKPLILFVLSLTACLYTVYRISAIPPFAFDVLRSGELYRVTEKGDIVNIYSLSIKNMTDRELVLAMEVRRPEAIEAIGPDSVMIRAGQVLRQNVTLLSHAQLPGKEAVTFIVRDQAGYEVQREGTFFSPEGR